MSNFIKIGSETPEEIGNKGEKCPRLPVSVLSLFSNKDANPRNKQRSRDVQENLDMYHYHEVQIEYDGQICPF